MSLYFTRVQSFYRDCLNYLSPNGGSKLNNFFFFHRHFNTSSCFTTRLLFRMDIFTFVVSLPEIIPEVASNDNDGDDDDNNDDARTGAVTTLTLKRVNMFFSTLSVVKTLLLCTSDNGSLERGEGSDEVTHRLHCVRHERQTMRVKVD